MRQINGVWHYNLNEIIELSGVPYRPLKSILRIINDFDDMRSILLSKEKTRLIPEESQILDKFDNPNKLFPGYLLDLIDFILNDNAFEKSIVDINPVYLHVKHIPIKTISKYLRYKKDYFVRQVRSLPRVKPKELSSLTREQNYFYGNICSSTVSNMLCVRKGVQMLDIWKMVLKEFEWYKLEPKLLAVKSVIMKSKRKYQARK